MQERNSLNTFKDVLEDIVQLTSLRNRRKDVNICMGKLPKDMFALYELCEYYRLVRNTAVHDFPYYTQY